MSNIHLSEIPLPPIKYRELVCGPKDVAIFEEVGRGLVTMLDAEGLTAPGTDFLDIGCG